jgi:hypothetical protein
LEGRTPKEKHPFLFQKKFHPAKSEMQGVFFLSGLLAYSASGVRMRSPYFCFAEALCFAQRRVARRGALMITILEIGSNLVQ